MAWKLLSDRPIVLTNGKLYEADLHLSFVEKFFSAETIAGRLEDLGFTCVVVNLTAPNGPTATGNWNKPDWETNVLPDEIVHVWEWEVP